MHEGMYAKTISGLTECYLMGLPFFQNQILGDLIYLGVMVGVYKFALAALPVGKTQEN